MEDFEGKLIKPIYSLDAHQGTVVSIIQPFHDSDYILSLSNDKFVLLWNLSFGNLLNEVVNNACPTEIIIFPRLGFLFIPKWNNTFSLIDLTIFNIPTKQIIDINFEEQEAIFHGHKSWVLHAIEVEGEDKFLTCSRDKTIRLWNIINTNCELILSEHKQIVNYVIQLEESIIASCSSDKTIKIWNINDQYEKSLINIYDGEFPVFQIEKLKDNCLVSRNETPELKIWDYSTGKLVRILSEHETNVICMKVLKNNLILSGSYDHTAKLWNKDKDKSLSTFIGHSFTVFSLAELKNGNIITGSGDGTIKLWDIKTSQCIQTFIGHDDYVVSLLCTKNNELISGSYDNSLKIWKIK